jgi:eukaryotic-like serine/threonine-protein kinase
MTIRAGTRLGSYEVIESIGAGGMGEVYRARDASLGRDIAIKVLPPSLSADPERLARFRREALLLASLNHPHIATVYGLEDAAGHPALTMELVEGPTLAERIAEGSLELDEALRTARQIAEGLAAAHQRGIVHRDLKPLNVKLTSEGSVKLLDFGLAKVSEPEAVTGTAFEALAGSPTLTNPAMTAAGVVLGTAAYMAPEQARGRAVDHRADIWAFGCVLYEMLTGRQAFGGNSLADVMGAIVHREPDWQALPPGTPQPIQRLLSRCLQKSADRRLHSAADAILEIDDALNPSVSDAAPPAHGSRWTAAVPWLVGVTSIAALAIGLSSRPADLPQAGVAKLTIALPEPLADLGRPAIALSPDGSRVGFVAQHGETTAVYLRPLDGFEAAHVPGTEGAVSLFFSPDGEWIGFYGGGRLKKVSTRGGPPVTLASFTDFMGASWGFNGTIVAAVAPQAMVAVPDAGGQLRPLVDPVASDVRRSLPHMLPGDRAFLLTVIRQHEPQGSVAVRLLESGEERILVPDATHAAYLDGALVFARSGTLFAVAFDPERLAIAGTPVPVLEGVLFNATFGTTQYAVSPGGRLAYAPGPSATGRLLSRIDRAGAATPLTYPRRPYYMPRVSPDGQRLAVTILDEGAYSIWTTDSPGGSMARLAEASLNPVWSPDGSRLAFTSARDGLDIAIMPSDGSRPATPIIVDGTYKLPTSWTPDGQFVVFTRNDPAGSTGEDIYIAAADGTGMHALAQSPENESSGVVSPDGEWLAYAAGGHTRTAIYVAALREPGRRTRVDTEDGYMPVWSRNGGELFFLTGTRRDRLMSVRVTAAADGLRLGRPERLFDQSMGGSVGFGLSRYDVTPDGRFVFATAQTPVPSTEIRVDLAWRAHLNRLTARR